MFNRLFRRYRHRQAEQIERDDLTSSRLNLSRLNCLTLPLPLDNLPTAQVRLLISQRIGLEQIVPIALARLEQPPALSGTPDGAALRESLQRLPREFWERHPDHHARWQKIPREPSR